MKEKKTHSTTHLAFCKYHTRLIPFTKLPHILSSPKRSNNDFPPHGKVKIKPPNLWVTGKLFTYVQVPASNRPSPG